MKCPRDGQFVDALMTKLALASAAHEFTAVGEQELETKNEKK
jgi:hypothetical protein